MMRESCGVHKDVEEPAREGIGAGHLLRVPRWALDGLDYAVITATCDAEAVARLLHGLVVKAVRHPLRGAQPVCKDCRARNERPVWQRADYTCSRRPWQLAIDGGSLDAWAGARHKNPAGLAWRRGWPAERMWAPEAQSSSDFSTITRTVALSPDPSLTVTGCSPSALMECSRSTCRRSTSMPMDRDNASATSVLVTEP